jgi:hypothetical protein
MSSSEDDNSESSGYRLKQRPRTEEEDVGTITNANLDVNNTMQKNIPTSTDFDKPNIADGFKRSQVLVNADGSEI